MDRIAAECALVGLHYSIISFWASSDNTDRSLAGLARGSQAVAGVLDDVLALRGFRAVAAVARECHARAMDEYFWPEDQKLGMRTRHAWPATVESLPVGSHVTGKVIGRQPFGVFISIDQTTDAVGLVRVTALPRGAQLPVRGESVDGQVLWHEPSNCQVIVTPSGSCESEPDNETDLSPERLHALRQALGGGVS